MSSIVSNATPLIYLAKAKKLKIENAEYLFDVEGDADYLVYLQELKEALTITIKASEIHKKKLDDFRSEELMLDELSEQLKTLQERVLKLEIENRAGAYKRVRTHVDNFMQALQNLLGKRETDRTEEVKENVTESE